MANQLGISLYNKDGRIHQIGPSEQVDPPNQADTSTYGRFLIAAAEKP